MWSQRSFLQNVWVQVLSLIALFIIQSSNLPFPLTFSRGSLPFKRMDARIWFGYMVWWSAHVSVPLILGQIHNDSWHGIISFQFLVTFSPHSLWDTQTHRKYGDPPGWEDAWGSVPGTKKSKTTGGHYALNSHQRLLGDGSAGGGVSWGKGEACSNLLGPYILEVFLWKACLSQSFCSGSMPFKLFLSTTL